MIFFECIIFGRLLRKIQTPAAPLLILVYIILLQVIYLISTYGDLDDLFSELSLLSYKKIPEKVLFLYAIIFMVTSFSCRDIVINFARIKRELIKWSSSKRNILTRWSVIVIMYAVIVANIICIDFDVMWSNDTYLLMNSPEGYNASAQMVTIMRFGLGLIGALGAFSLPVLFASNDKAKFFCILPLWLFVFLFQLSAHSRSAAVYAFILCMSIIIFSRIPKFLSILTSLIFIFSIVIFALEGRSQDLHGIGELFTSVYLAYQSFDITTLMSAIINIFQGIFSTGDALLYDVEHDYMYKILSISPLPSFIDGFDQIREAYEIRLHLFIPMSAIAELYNFGLFFSLPVLMFYYWLLRESVKLLRSHNNVISIFINVYIFVIFVMANAYPLRNVFRQLIISLLMIFIYRFVANKRMRATPATS